MIGLIECFCLTSCHQLGARSFWGIMKASSLSPFFIHITCLILFHCLVPMQSQAIDGISYRVYKGHRLALPENQENFPDPKQVITKGTSKFKCYLAYDTTPGNSEQSKFFRSCKVSFSLCYPLLINNDKSALLCLSILEVSFLVSYIVRTNLYWLTKFGSPCRLSILRGWASIFCIHIASYLYSTGNEGEGTCLLVLWSKMRQFYRKATGPEYQVYVEENWDKKIDCKLQSLMPHTTNIATSQGINSEDGPETRIQKCVEFCNSYPSL